MNILLLSAGRRTSLLSLLRKAVEPDNGRVFAADFSGLAPALRFAHDAFRLPLVHDEAYADALIELVETHTIDAIIPTIDSELAQLCSLRSALADRGCTAVVSDLALVEVSADKARTGQHFGAQGIRIPRAFTEQDIRDLRLPEHVFVKPRFGSASAGAMAVPSEHLASVLANTDRPIVQEMIAAPEVTVDAFLDLEGRPLHYVPRRRLKTLGGESIQAVTIDDGETSQWIVDVLKLCGSLGGKGPLTLQYFETSPDPTLLEVNPRFGGGFPLGYEAGGRYTDWLIDLLRDRPVAAQLGSYERGLYMTRFLQEAYSSGPKWPS